MIPPTTVGRPWDVPLPNMPYKAHAPRDAIFGAHCCLAGGACAYPKKQGPFYQRLALSLQACTLSILLLKSYAAKGGIRACMLDSCTLQDNARTSNNACHLPPYLCLACNRLCGARPSWPALGRQHTARHPRCCALQPRICWQQSRLETAAADEAERASWQSGRRIFLGCSWDACTADNSTPHMFHSVEACHCAYFAS